MAEVPTTAVASGSTSSLISVVNAQLAEWKSRGAHVLAPMVLQVVPSFFRPVCVAVPLDPDPAHKEVYPQRGGGLSISALGWKKIADAMGIEWVPGECGREDDGSNPRKVCYRMVGQVRGMDGVKHRIMGSKEIDLDVIEEEARDNYRQKAIDYANDPKDGPVFRRDFPTPEKVQAWIDEKVRQDVLQMRKHMLARAQSGALARATKNIGIRETYTAAELRQPFVFPKLVFSPDENNPQDRQFLLEQAAGVTHSLYRPAAATIPPPSRLAMAREIAAEEVVFLDPGSDEPTWEEVLRDAFTKSAIAGQVEILAELMKRKAYDQKKLKGLPAQWSAQDRAQFFNRLLELPDAPASSELRPLPFE